MYQLVHSSVPRLGHSMGSVQESGDCLPMSYVCLSTVRHCAVVSWKGHSCLQMFLDVTLTHLSQIRSWISCFTVRVSTTAKAPQSRLSFKILSNRRFSVSLIITLMGVKADLQHIARVEATPRDDLTATVRLYRLVLTCFADEILYCTSQGQVLRFNHTASAPIPCIEEKCFMTICVVAI